MKTARTSDHVNISGPLIGIGVQGYQHRCVESLCRRFVSRNCTVVEVGCLYGMSTVIFARHAKRVIAVDPFEDRIARMRYGANTKGLDNIQELRGYSPGIAAEIPDGTVDLVYVDALHDKESVLADVRAWLPKIKGDGILAGHDYHLHNIPEFGVPLALHEVFGRGPDVCAPDTSWAYRLPL